jgi:hypothetical protein
MSKQPTFQVDEEKERLIREREANPARYQASHSFNGKRAVEIYEAMKRKAEKQ